MAVVTTAVAVGVAAAASVAGAVESKKQADKKEKLIKAETGELVSLKENEIQDVQAAQTTAFANSGVLLEGTPLEVLESTRQEGERQKDAIRRTGKAQGDLANSQGRQAFISGIGNAAGAVAGGVQSTAAINARS